MEDRGGSEALLEDEAAKAEKKDDVLGAMLGNFSVQYNFQAIAIALTIAGRAAATSRQGSWVNEQTKSSVFIGCILGQICMGYVGDVVGRKAAMSATLSLAAVGALASAVCPWGGATSTYAIIVVARFIIGFGLGGVYPLSAAQAAESAEKEDDAIMEDPSQTDENNNEANIQNQEEEQEVKSLKKKTLDESKREAAARAADAFFWQAPGEMAPYIMAIILRATFQSQQQSLQWRLLLGLGGIPAAFVVWWQTKAEEKNSDALHDNDLNKKQNQRQKTNDALRAVLVKPETLRTFLGTGGGWLLYDVAFYGFTLMGPTVVAECFKGDDHESIQDDAWQQMFALSTAIPAVKLTTYFIRKGYELKPLQIAGFYLMAAAYITFALVRTYTSLGSWYLYILYCIINFCLTFGPNVTTFVIPSATYARATRATFSGASSAAGKLGAVIGTELLPLVNATYGLNAVIYLCAAVSILGALTTQACVHNALLTAAIKTPSQPRPRTKKESPSHEQPHMSIDETPPALLETTRMMGGDKSQNSASLV